MPTLTLIGEAARNKHGQRCVNVQCSCGSAPFTIREDSFKQGHTTSCGCVRRVRKLKSIPASVSNAASVDRMVTSFNDVIAAKEAAALAAEKRAHALELKMKEQDHTDLDTHKAHGVETKTARNLRQEVARLKTTRDKAETALVKDGRTLEQINRDKIAQLQSLQS
jgi:hypothetical protein